MYCRESARAREQLIDLQELLVRDGQCNKPAARKVIFVQSQMGMGMGEWLSSAGLTRPGRAGRLCAARPHESTDLHLHHTRLSATPDTRCCVARSTFVIVVVHRHSLSLLLPSHRIACRVIIIHRAPVSAARTPCPTHHCLPQTHPRLPQRAPATAS
jgi:hypothetical protein